MASTADPGSGAPAPGSTPARQDHTWRSAARAWWLGLQRTWLGSPAQGSPLQSAKSGDLLSQALDDAELLLAFAVQSNRSVDATLVAALIDAVADIRCPGAAGAADNAEGRSGLPAGQPGFTDPCKVGSAQRKPFWKAYDDLALAMAPVSAHSIRETRRYLDQPRLSVFFSSTFQLAIVSVAVFLAALVLQSRWLEGKRIEDRLRNLDTAYEKQHAEFRTAFDRLCALTTLGPLPRLVAGKPAAGARAVAKPVAAAATGEEGLQLQQAQRQVWMGTHAREMIEQRQQRLLGEIESWHAAVAYPLDHFFEHLLSLTSSTSARSSRAAAVPIALPAAAAEPSPPATVAAPLSLCQAGPQLPAAVARLRAEAETKRMAFEAKLGLLETVWIPMLMGLLGASTYMLRLLVLQLKTSTFTPRFPSLSLVRLVLGMIVGVLGGSLLPVIGEGGIKALPPLAMPFVFGYAIEVLFAGLDKLVSSFTPAAVAPSAAR